jgi:hypothetical protein
MKVVTGLISFNFRERVNNNSPPLISLGLLCFYTAGDSLDDSEGAGGRVDSTREKRYILGGLNKFLSARNRFLRQTERYAGGKEGIYAGIGVLEPKVRCAPPMFYVKGNLIFFFRCFPDCSRPDYALLAIRASSSGPGFRAAPPKWLSS